MMRLLMVAPLVLVTQAMFVAGSATQSESTRLIFGEGGGSSCGVWRQERHAPTPKVGRLVQWVAGYLSGVNTERTSSDFLVGTDFDGLMAWVDNYCQSHPLDAVGIAAAKLVIELRSRAAH
jgi:hypothetical protein